MRVRIKESVRSLLVRMLHRVDGTEPRVDSERYFIPDEFEFSHRLCFMLHDLLTDVVVQGEKDGIFKIHLEIKDKTRLKEMEGLRGEELLSWLEDQGFETEVVLLIYKTVCLGLLSDLCHFLYEALKNSEKGKLTVCYSLLRKPFVENLFYLEWMLGDLVDFLRRFKDGSADDLDLQRNEELKKKEKRLAIIAKAIAEAKSSWSDAELIYELRYDKGAPHSFQMYWQHANHLITTQKHYKTTPTNFNFLYSLQEEKEVQWTFLYSYLPLILIHTYDVVEALISKFAIRRDHAIDVTDLRVRAGFVIWASESIFAADEMTELVESFKSVLTNMNIPCPYCETKYVFTHENLNSFYIDAILECSKCGEDFDLTSILGRS